MGWSRKAGALIVTLVWVGGCGTETESGAMSDQAGGTAQISDQLLLASVKVGLPPEGVTRADLPQPESQGAVLLERFCTGCHALSSPGSHSATDWPGVVRRMWLRTERTATSFGVPVPETAERLVIMRYLLDNALRVSAGSLPMGAGLSAFTATCARCHELPDPSQHSRQDWPAVLLRMGGHIESMLGETLPPAQMQQISAYLEGASGSAQ
ncbi:MAG TPA: hypothetical protein VGA37_10240 [Gemmatimonadales bacterium]